MIHLTDYLGKKVSIHLKGDAGDVNGKIVSIGNLNIATPGANPLNQCIVEQENTAPDQRTHKTINGYDVESVDIME